MPHIALVVAMDDNGLIGREGGLPWHLPNDLKHFKALTVGKTVLMGRKTWDSLGRPLPQRDNWVVSRDASFAAEGATGFTSLKMGLDAAGERELMVIGGAQIYAQSLAFAQQLHITRVHTKAEGDTWFPAFDATQFREVSREDFAADERHAYAYSFITLERIAAS